MELRPAPPGTGIVFCRTDRPAGSRRTIEAVYDNVVDATLCTAIGNGRVTVRTIEHLMAAFAGCGIDNAVVELDGEEVPAMDGSAAPFVFLIECAGIVEQCAPRRMIEVLKPIRLGDESRYISIAPAERSPSTARSTSTIRRSAISRSSSIRCAPASAPSSRGPGPSAGRRT